MIPQGGSIGGMSGEDASSYASVPNPQAREAPPPHVPPQQQRNSSRNEAQWSESQPPSRVSAESVAVNTLEDLHDEDDLTYSVSSLALLGPCARSVRAPVSPSFTCGR
eukprot:GHVU01005748.1.p3 GENE.GHVU01005748.1~~GHVU01005748.1.p3  ORF type:complete len:108 (+),score=8.67 GHVU01005748.1:374-697(+)